MAPVAMKSAISFRLLPVLCFFALLNSVQAQKQAYDILPPNTQAVVWVSSTEQLMEKWDRTQLAELIRDEAVAPFFEGKRQEIEQKFLEAGWRLTIKPEDVGQFSAGQLAFAWTDRDDPVKPYSMILIGDIENDADINADMIKAFEKQLDERKAKKQTLSFEGITINQYTLPPRPGEYIKQVSYVAVVPGQSDTDSAHLLAADDLPLLKNLIQKIQGELTTISLSDDAVFVRGRELAQISNEGDIEYFVRPLGFAEVIRAIAGTRSKSKSNRIQALKNQGFDAIKCICGELTVGGKDLDVEHHGYVYAELPFVKSAKALNFRNEASHDIPNFVGEETASLLSINWAANEAFWELEGLVDEIANTQGLFEEVINGFKTDAHGPQVDLREILPLFTNDIFSIADSRPGEAEVDSRRNLLALKLTDPDKMLSILRDAMNNEVDAEQVEFEGIEIWQVSEETEEDTSSEFGDFAAPPPAAGANNAKWLEQWAITVYGDYLLFASHLELIEDAIQQGRVNETSPLLETADYTRAHSAITEFFGEDAGCAWRILRASKAYRVQYELFRKGELRRSESMLASILDRLIQKDEEMDSKEQKISGEGLPRFSEIAGYLQPSAFNVQSTADGWEFASFLLSKDYKAKPAKALEVTKSSAQYGTATAPLDLSTKR